MIELVALRYADGTVRLDWPPRWPALLSRGDPVLVSLRPATFHRSLAAALRSAQRWGFTLGYVRDIPLPSALSERSRG